MMNSDAVSDDQPPSYYRFAIMCEGKPVAGDKMTALADALVGLEECADLDAVAAHLRGVLADREWYIYRCRRHVVLHENYVAVFAAMCTLPLHERGWFRHIRENRLLLIRETESWEREPMIPALRGPDQAYNHVRLLSEPHAPLGAATLGALRPLVERQFYRRTRYKSSAPQIGGP